MEEIVIEAVTCSQTYAIHESYVFPADLNNGGIQFGGKTLAIMDANAGLAAAKFIPPALSFVTAGYDHVQFINPATPKDILKCTSYVTGAHGRTIEVFTKFTTFNKDNRKLTPALVAFCTLIVTVRHTPIQLPELIPESEEERFVCSGYEQRLAARKTDLMANKAILGHLNY